MPTGTATCNLWDLYPLLVALVVVLVVVVSIVLWEARSVHKTYCGLKNDTYTTYLGQVGSLKIFLLGDPIF